jgi:hypothetical protein
MNPHVNGESALSIFKLTLLSDSGLRFPAGEIDISLLHRAHTDFGAHPASCSTGSPIRLHGAVPNELITGTTFSLPLLLFTNII